jgi:uncharacterized protein YecE (DUF72 family)
VGCSGWLYPHWRGDFYPKGMPASGWLAHYAGAFDTVELNNSFYRLPEGKRFAAWRRQTPEGFLFAVKASRYLTHMKKLKDPRPPLRLFFSRVRNLRSKLGPVLYQLPPRWKPDAGRLAAFLDALPRRQRHALEFRDPRWYREDILSMLERRRAALCIHDMRGSESPRRTTAPFVYMRFHGAGARYGGRYPAGALRKEAGWIRERLDSGLDVYAYFNNDSGGHAPRDADRLRNLVLSD